MTLARYILFILLFVPEDLLAKSNESVILASNIMEEQSVLTPTVLFWSKVFILLLIMVLGFLSYRNFRSEEQ
jgi:hypothetical protein